MSRLTELDLWNYYELTKPVKNRNPETANKTLFVAVQEIVLPFLSRTNFIQYDFEMKNFQTLWIPLEIRYKAHERITGTPHTRYIFQLVNKPRLRVNWFPESGTFLCSDFDDCVTICAAHNDIKLSLKGSDNLYHIKSFQFWKDHYL